MFKNYKSLEYLKVFKKIIFSLSFLSLSNYLHASNVDITEKVDPNYKANVKRSDYGKIFINFERDPQVDLTNHSAHLKFGDDTIWTLSDFGENTKNLETFVYCWALPNYLNKPISVDIINKHKKVAAYGYYDYLIQEDLYNIDVKVNYVPESSESNRGIKIQVGANKNTKNSYSLKSEIRRIGDSTTPWVTKTTKVGKEGNNFNTQEELNQFIGKQAVPLYEKLNTNSRYPNSEIEEPKIEGKYWNVAYLDQQGIFTVSDKNTSYSPSRELNQIFENKNVIDCFIARTLVTAKIISDVLGPDKFDFLYKKYKERWNNKTVFLANFCGLFSGSSEATIGDYRQPGGLVCISNFPNYAYLNPKGRHAGNNLITTWDNNEQRIKYIGFGPIFSKGPITYGAATDYMIERYSLLTSKKYKHNPYKIINANNIELVIEKSELYREKEISAVRNYFKTIIKDNFFITDLLKNDPAKNKLLDRFQIHPTPFIALKWIDVAEAAKTQQEINRFLTPHNNH